MKKKMKFVRTGILALVVILAISFCLVSCNDDEIGSEETTTELEEGPRIPTAADVANTVNGYVEQMLGQVGEPENSEAIDIGALLEALSNVNVALENPSPDNSVFGGMDKIVFANNVLHATSHSGATGQAIDSYIMRLTENGIIYISGENGSYIGEYQTWHDLFGYSDEDARGFSQIDINAIKEALRVEENDIKVVEDGLYEIKSSYIIGAIKDITKALGYEDANNSVSLGTLLNMTLTVDVRQHAEGVMVIDLNIPNVVEAKVNILDKDEFKVDYELDILGSEEASESDSVATLTGNLSVKTDEFNFSMNLDIPSESASFKVACTGRNAEAQLSANLSIDVQVLEDGYEEKATITAEVSAETDAEGNITIANGKASMKYNDKDVLTATLNYSVTDGIVSGKCLVEFQQDENKLVVEGQLSAQLREDGIPSAAKINLTATLNEMEMISVGLDYALSETDSGEKTITLDATMAVDNATIDIKSKSQINNNKFVSADIELKFTGITSGTQIVEPTESLEDLASGVSKSESFIMTVSISTVSSSDNSTKYHCVFFMTENEGESQTLGFDITFGGVRANLTNDEKMLIGYYESLLANYDEYVIRSEEYANAIRQMAEQGILPSVLPESFCLLDPKNHKVGYLCDIYKNWDGTYEVCCSIDVNDPLNSYLEYYPVIESFVPVN